jgi:hypothetical protein
MTTNPDTQTTPELDHDHISRSAMREAAQIAFDQQSDEPCPGDWNAACVRIAVLLREIASHD